MGGSLVHGVRKEAQPRPGGAGQNSCPDNYHLREMGSNARASMGWGGAPSDFFHFISLSYCLLNPLHWLLEPQMNLDLAFVKHWMSNDNGDGPVPGGSDGGRLDAVMRAG